MEENSGKANVLNKTEKPVRRRRVQYEPISIVLAFLFKWLPTALFSSKEYVITCQ